MKPGKQRLCGLPIFFLSQFFSIFFFFVHLNIFFQAWKIKISQFPGERFFNSPISETSRLMFRLNYPLLFSPYYYSCPFPSKSIFHGRKKKKTNFDRIADFLSGELVSLLSAPDSVSPLFLSLLSSFLSFSEHNFRAVRVNEKIKSKFYVFEKKKIKIDSTFSRFHFE